VGGKNAPREISLEVCIEPTTSSTPVILDNVNIRKELTEM
jgi:hypothetical protein